MQPESFPRQSARTHRFTAGAPRGFTIAPDGVARRVRALVVRHRRRRPALGARHRLGGGAPDRRPDRAPRRSGGALARGARPSRAHARGQQRHRRLLDRHGGNGRGVRALRRPVRRAPRRVRCCRRPRRARPGGRPAGVSRRHARRVRLGTLVAGRAHRRHRRPRRWPSPRTRPRPAASPTSSRPRSSTDSAASGGRPARTRCSWSASTRPRCSSGGSPTRCTPSARRHSTAIRRRVPRTPWCRWRSRGSTAPSRRWSWDSTAYPYLADVAWQTAATRCSWCCRATSATSRCWPSTGPPARPPWSSSLHDDAWVDAAPGATRWSPRRRAAEPAGGPRDRHLPAARGRRLAEPGGPAGARRPRRRRRRRRRVGRAGARALGRRARGLGRHRDGADAVDGLARRPLRRRDRRRRLPHPRQHRGGLRGDVRGGYPRRHEPRRAPGRHPGCDAPRGGAVAHPHGRALPDRPRARLAPAPRGAQPVRRTAPRRGARRGRASSARTSGSPTRASASSSPTDAGPRVAARRGTARCTATSRPRCSTTRSRRSRPVAAAWPDDVDTERVGIRGWSFGGYLAALAVLRRPDVFHAAVAGAPGDRVAALRHRLHRALPRRPDRGPGAVRRLLAAPARSRAHPTR